jgi:predicted nucleotidyltransferase
MKYSTPRSAEKLMTENLLVKHYAGSHAYGTALPTSDTDFRGIFCADPVNVLTPFFPVRECTDTNEEDTKLYELAHFMKLCLDCNPNIIETLWVDDSDIVTSTAAYDHLRLFRQDLLSSKAAFTFSGYALAQLKRIKGHNKWINNPQDVDPPKQADFVSMVQNFTSKKIFKIDLREYRDGYRLVPYGHNIFGLVEMKGYQTFSDDFSLNTNYQESENLGHGFFGRMAFSHMFSNSRKRPLFVVKFNKDEYLLAKDQWKNYWTWKNNRNEKRSELEEQFGYDTKHAMHLVRLLRMGVEILRDGDVIVKRPDAQELLDIRSGAWEYDELVKYAEDMDKQVREVWYKQTPLRKKPDLKFAAQLLMETQEIVWSSNG